MRRVIEATRASALRARESAKRFKQEFKKTSGGAIIGAIGLVVALAWKDVVDQYLLRFKDALQGKIISALFITAISVLLIMVITKLMQESEEKKEEAK
jgi:hypothetical protein